MLEWIQSNIGNIVVFTAVALIVGIALIGSLKAAKESCNGHCAGCSMNKLCQPDENGENGLLSAYRQANPKQN